MSDLIDLESSFARPEVVDAVTAALESLARPGTFFTGAQRVAIYRQSRAARTCSLCAERRDAVSPYAVDGDHVAADGLSAVEIDAVHRISTDSGRLSEKWHGDVGAGGLDDARLVELIAATTTGIVLDTLHRGLGLELPGVPEPVDGSTTGSVSDRAVIHSAWVPTVPPESADETVADLYAARGGDIAPFTPNIIRALTLVPASAVDFLGLLAALYVLSTDEVPVRWGITRPQIELVAASVSAHNDCFY